MNNERKKFIDMRTEVSKSEKTENYCLTDKFVGEKKVRERERSDGNKWLYAS
jgi:hypothetical protein